MRTSMKALAWLPPVVGDGVAEREAGDHVGSDVDVDGLPVEPGPALRRRVGGDRRDLERAALRVVVVGQHRDRDAATGTNLDDVGAGDRRLVEHLAVGDGDDHDRGHGVGRAVGDAVAEGRPLGSVGGDGDQVPDAVDLLHGEAVVGRVTDERHDVAVGVAVVGEHVDEARPAGGDDDVVADRRRGPVRSRAR